MLAQMRQLSDSFYRAAQRVGHHQFLEINGLLVILIKQCQRTLEAEVDFQMNEIPLESYDAHYVGEKLGCIWGTALTDKENLASFLRGLYEMPNNISVTVDVIEREGVVIKISNPNKEATGDAEESREEESTSSPSSPSSDGVLSSSGI